MLSLLVAISDSFVYTYLIISLFGMKWSEYKRQNMMFIVSNALLTFLLFQLDLPFESFILLSIAIQTLIMKWLFPFSWNLTFLMSITKIGLQTITELFTLYLFSDQLGIYELSRLPGMKTFIEWTFDCVMLAIGIYLNVKKIALFRWFTVQQNSHKKYLIMITALFLFHDELIHTLMIRTIEEPREANGYLVSVSVLADLFMAVIIYFIFSLGKNLDQKMIDMTESIYLKNLEDLISSVRSQRHDYHTHLQVIGGLIHRDEYGNAKEYLKELFAEIEHKEVLLQLDHPPLAVLLQAKVEIAKAHHIDMKIVAHSTIPSMDVKSYELVQIVGNLLINAIAEERKAPLPNRSITVTLVRMMNSFIVIRVHNASSWISPENLNKIFNKGFTTKKGHKGLGLATVTQLISKYQGHIEVESNQADGTTFLVFIPYYINSGSLVTTAKRKVGDKDFVEF